jgi:hypothetical protein
MRNTKLTEKDMSIMREADSARTQSKQTSGVLRDYSLRHRVEMRWDLNDDAKRDQIFELKVDGLTVLLDWEQVARLGRWI